ncbi:MAG: hypothetical protein QM820_54545 [Minicystis sp.]
MPTVDQLPRPDKKKLGRAILTNLQERKAAGPAEQALDAFIPELETIVVALEGGVDGQAQAAAALKALLLKMEEADIEVDTDLRHIYHYISVEADRRAGPHVASARALLAATFADGLAHVDDYIPDENKLCRETIDVLRSPEHAPAVTAIKLPIAWIAQWEAHVDASDAAFQAVQKARAGKSIHVLAGQDAEVAFVDVMSRLRKYIDSRAPRNDKVKIAQGRLLIQPLLDLLAKIRADERARETRKEHAKKSEAKKDETKKGEDKPATPPQQATPAIDETG